MGSGAKALGGHRFNLVNVLPVAVVACYLVALARAGAYGSGPVDWGRVIPTADARGAVEAIALVVVVVLASILLQPFQVTVVRLLEGYWGRSLGIPAMLMISHHQRLAFIAGQDARDRYVARTTTDLPTVHARQRRVAAKRRRRVRALALHARYPRKDRMLPTMLGNILRRGEDAAGGRYGLDAMTVYPRIYPSLHPRLDAAMSRQLDLIDTTAALTVAFAVAAAASAPLMITQAGEPAMIYPVALAAAMFVAYRGARAAAEGHAMLLATVLDVHRFDLLRALHLPLPGTVREEITMNRSLSQFLARGGSWEDVLGLDQRYVHAVLNENQPVGGGADRSSTDS